MNKSFVLTVDTESDNQWNMKHTQTTENANFIPRFQSLCEDYGIRPVYLIDYSMSKDKFLVSFLKEKKQRNLCEIGMHLHAWDTPPMHDLDSSIKGRPYLIEYPIEIMEEKISSITDRLEYLFCEKMLSHRAGRWAINKVYAQLLYEHGYRIDCSITPGINWNSQSGGINGGPDYSRECACINKLFGTNILEVPMTVKYIHTYYYENNMSFNQKIKQYLKYLIGRNVWLRPALFSNKEMFSLIEKCHKENVYYLEYMIHSSELMPNGSPYFKSNEEIDILYKKMEELFIKITSLGYIGNTLQELYVLNKNQHLIE